MYHLTTISQTNRQMSKFADSTRQNDADTRVTNRQTASDKEQQQNEREIDRWTARDTQGYSNKTELFCATVGDVLQ